MTHDEIKKLTAALQLADYFVDQAMDSGNFPEQTEQDNRVVKAAWAIVHKYAEANHDAVA